MNNRKIISLLLVLLLCFAMTACGGNASDSGSDEGQSSIMENSAESSSEDQSATDPISQEDGATPLLYKVTDSKGNVIWLFGSIHVGAEYFYPLPDYVLNAFDNADSLAVEFDIVDFEKDLTAQTQALMNLVYTDGTTIKDNIPTELYDRAVAILKENNVYNGFLDYYFPVFWSNLIDTLLYEKLNADVESGIDRHMIDRAYALGKEVLDVESADFQYGMMASFSQELQEMLLGSSIESFNGSESEMKAELDELMTAWAKGNEAEFAEIVNEEEEFENDEERRLYEEYNNAMVISRNLSMAEYAENALASGKEVFICVGAAHVVGEGAMADLLSDRGYTVELIR